MTYDELISLEVGDLVQNKRTKHFRVIVRCGINGNWDRFVLKNPLNGRANGWATRSEMEHNWDKLPVNSEIAKNLYGK